MSNAIGIKGPAIPGSSEAAIDLPDCVKLSSKKDVDEFQAFVAGVIKAANQNALDRLADFVAQQNVAMAELVKRLGG